LVAQRRLDALGRIDLPLDIVRCVAGLALELAVRHRLERADEDDLGFVTAGQIGRELDGLGRGVGPVRGNGDRPDHSSRPFSFERGSATLRDRPTPGRTAARDRPPPVRDRGCPMA
jgi:hypothetical protein